ncbi:MAG: cation:proton antiporter [Proteobacteria bacterium]|nr:cation:proton antiporter [Pseudomonadota bacterium]
MELIDFSLFKFLETLHPLIYIGLLLLLSYAGGKIANYLKAPRVTGYLVIGMLLSPSVLGLFHERLVKEELTLITDIALAIIAFSIGGSLGLGKLRRLGRHIFWITFTQTFGAFLVATIALALFFYLIHGLRATLPSFWALYFPMAFVIGAICAATAPAAILALVHEYRSKGPLTSILLGVVALDDALTIVLYAFAITIAKTFVNQEAITWENFLLSPVFSIMISLSIGGVLGVSLRKLIRFVTRREAMIGVMVGSIFLVSGLAISLEASPLLANMMLGFVVTNFVGHHEDLFGVVESIEEPIFGMFFALAGAHLDLRVMQTAGWLALLITLGRFAGKLLGSRLGAQISQAPEAVKKYLGFALLPKAGVTVGLVLEAKEIFSSTYLSEVMVNAVLGSVIINELVTPFFVRFALTKAGEAMRTKPA